ncbi:hypothetical protein GCM10027059_06540 [Myceligenerans halotolerans]
MNAPAPVAVAYVSASDPCTLDAQREAITVYVRTEGYALAQIVTDRYDGFTISQIAETARLHQARLVVVPACTSLATVHARLTDELEPTGAVCVVIDQTPGARDGPMATSPPATTAVGPRTATATHRLTDALGRHSFQHSPRHAARTHA